MTAYISTSDANTWILSHVAFPEVWTANSTKQAAALEQASDAIDSLALKGVRYSITQSREFPRIPDRSAFVAYSESEALEDIDYSEVPQEVLDACCLEALEILKRGGTQRLENQQQGVLSQSLAGTSETYDPAAGKRKLLSLAARRLLSHWIAGAVEAV